MSRPVKLSVLLVLLGTASACRSTTPTKSTSVANNPEQSQRPVAKVGAEVITESELQSAIKPRLVRLEGEHAEKVHGLKSQSLDELIANRLIANKAKAEGITTEALLDREVNSKVKTPTDSELQAFYDQAKASGQQVPPFDQVKGEIATFMKDRGVGQAKKELIDKLRAETKVEKMMPPLLLPKVEVAADGHSKGDPKAPITIVEFSDYECPYCSRAEEAVKRVLGEYKGKVRLVYRDFPLPFHGKAQKASEAALCAGDQGKYWEMHEKLFANQQALDVAQLKDHAKAVGVDQAKFDQCLDSSAKAKVVENSKKAGEAVGVTGTPAFFINGRPLSGAVPFEQFKEIIDHELSGG
ncbi:MAG TPA: thioredoxin domain-containing protein [Polyangia bacterium]